MSIRNSEWITASFLPDVHTNRISILGFPGAGNVISATLIKRIRETVAGQQMPPTSPETAAVLHGFASHYNSLLAALSRAVPLEWNAKSYFQHAVFDRADFIVELPGQDFVIVCRVSLGSYLNSEIHSVHQPLTLEAASFYAAKGYRLIAMVRHPLDIIQSLANKLTLGPGIDWPVSGQFDGAEKIRRLVNDARWLRGTALLLTEFYRQLPRAEEHFEVTRIRYEDCLTAPIDLMREIGKVLDVRLSWRDCETIAGLVGSPAAIPGHMLSPVGLEKWRARFSANCLRIIESETHLWDVFCKLGYSKPRPDDAQATLPELRDPLSMSPGIYYAALIGSFSPMEIAEAYSLPPIAHCWAGHHLVIGSTMDLVKTYVAHLSEAMLEN